MENIDDLMRQKFDSDNPGERFEFEEEYWEQAQALLEAEEARRRKKRRWLLWFLFFTLAAAGSIWQLGFPNPGNPKNASNIHLSSATNPGQSPASNESPSNAGNPTINGTREDQTNTREKIESTAAAESTSKSNTLAKRKASGLSKIHFQKSTTSAFAGHKKRKSTEGFDRDSATGNIPKNDLGQSANQTPDPGKTPQVNGASPQDKPDPSMTAADQSAASPTVNPSTTEGVKHATEAVDQVTGKDKLPAGLNPLDGLSAIDTAKASTKQPMQSQIIPTLLRPVERAPKAYNREKVAQPMAQLTKPSKDSRFHLGLSLAGSLYSPEPGGQWLGWAAGVWGKYDLNSHWSLSLGAGTRFLPGYQSQSDTLNPQTATVLRYSFGFDREQWDLSTQGLWNLEIPLKVHWRQGRWSTEAGVTPGFLLAVQQTLTHTRSSSLSSTSVDVQKHIAGEKVAYNTQYISASLGAAWQINKRFSLVMNVQRRFKPVLKPTPDGAKQTNIWGLDAGLQVRLF